MANSVEAVWKTIREITLDDIRKASRLPVKVALVGVDDDLAWLQAHFRGRTSHEGDLRRTADSLRFFELPIGPDDEGSINKCTFACVSPAGSTGLFQSGTVIKVPIFTIGTEGEWDHFKREILDSRWDLHLTLGRNFPGIRPDVLDYVIRNTACVNAEVAIVSGALFNIPSIGPIYPGVAFGDTVILTKNQVMMAFRLAGACGHAVDIVHRKTEVISIIGGGLGWRTLARAAAGAIPVLGIPLKGAFAFAGTFAVGKSLAHFLDTGRRLEPKTEQRIYADAVESGKVFASDTLRRLTRRQKAFRRRGRRT